MSADPEPNDAIRSHLSEDEIIVVNSSGIDRKPRVHFLELQASMIGIVAKVTICGRSLLADSRWKRSEQFTKSTRPARVHKLSGSSGSVRPASSSAIASAASVSKSSGERANNSSQCSSELSSSSIHAPKRSCSSAGSLDALSKAFFSSSVMNAVHDQIKVSRRYFSIHAAEGRWHRRLYVRVHSVPPARSSRVMPISVRRLRIVSAVVKSLAARASARS